MIEGGPTLLKNIIKNRLWHEARIIQSQSNLEAGIKAPVIRGHIKKEYDLDDNKILIIKSL